jgi:hypothetical protein
MAGPVVDGLCRDGPVIEGVTVAGRVINGLGVGAPGIGENP